MAVLSCRPSHSRLRHFLCDFGECRLGRLLFCFSFTHTPIISRVRGAYRSIWIKLTFARSGRGQAEIDWFAHQPSLDAAIEKAALAVNSRGKRYSHQRRLKKAALKEALRNLLDESGAMEQASDFDDLFKLIGAAVNEHCAFQTRLLEKAKGLSAHL